MRKIFCFLFLLTISFAQAQELNCTVKVSADQVGGTNTQIYKTLEKSLNDFVNKTQWTNKDFKPNERINCSMVIIVSAISADQFTASIQVQSSRQIFNSTYSSPVFNYNDKDFSFNYTEFQNLQFNPTNFDNNLVSVSAFYSHIIIGMDADTFALKGGSSSLETAQEICNVAQGNGYKGWAQGDTNQNRYFIVNDMLSNAYSPYREAMYQYHLLGLDLMSKDLKTAKLKVKDAITTLSAVHQVRPNAFVMRMFFDAKTDEIVSIFSGGPSIPVADLVDTLGKISPLNSSKWAGIKF